MKCNVIRKRHSLYFICPLCNTVNAIFKRAKWYLGPYENCIGCDIDLDHDGMASSFFSGIVKGGYAVGVDPLTEALTDRYKYLHVSDFVVGSEKRAIYRKQQEMWGSRENWKCCICGKKYSGKQSIHFHHIDYIRCKRVLVCHSCHRKIHSPYTVDEKYLQYRPHPDKDEYKQLKRLLGVKDR